MEEENWDILQKEEKKRLHELYSDDWRFFRKAKTGYKKITTKISENVYNFVEKHKEKLKKIEKALEPAFLVYIGTAVADYAATAIVCKYPSQELTWVVRNLMENHGIERGLLFTALGDAGLLGLSFNSNEYIDGWAKKSDSRIENLPLIRRLLISYPVLASAGIHHIKGYLSCRKYF